MAPVTKVLGSVVTVVTSTVLWTIHVGSMSYESCLEPPYGAGEARVTPDGRPAPRGRADVGVPPPHAEVRQVALGGRTRGGQGLERRAGNRVQVFASRGGICICMTESCSQRCAE